MAASVCCRRKVATVKIEKLKAFIIKYYNNYLIYKNKQYKSCNLKHEKHKLEKIVKCTECSRNLIFEKRTDQNFITQNLRHGKNVAFPKKRSC